MNNIVRYESEPECLEKEKQKELSGEVKEGVYNCQDVRAKLKSDFFNKCYLCESIGNKDFETEHFLPKKLGIDAKFSWKNLFWCCSYCNNRKSDSYNTKPENELLNCTISTNNVENWIIYQMPSNLISNFNILVNKTEVPNEYIKKTENTVELLNKIYNGNLKTKENTDNLKEKVFEDIKSFQNKIEKYYKGEKKEKQLKKIKNELKKKESEFTCFKRQLVKDKYNEFEKYFD